MKVFKNALKLLIIISIVFICISVVHAEDTNSTDVLFEEQDDVNNDTLIEQQPKSYTDLSNEVNDAEVGSTLNLTESYKYNSTIDQALNNGIELSKDITIVGINSNYIDGSFLARGLMINPNCHVVLKNLTFKNCFSKTHGAGINVGENATLILENCIFHSNKVYNSDGGAINGGIGCGIEIYNSEFYNNTATRVSGLTWADFKAGMGSVICMRIGTSLKMIDTTVRDNIGYLTTILVITWNDVDTRQSTLYVDNCLFENNVARTNSVLYLDEFGIAEIKNSVFKKNVATYSAGTVSFDSSKSVLVKNCTFEDNAGLDGGAIYIPSYKSKYQSNITLIDCMFNDNYAAYYGGAIFAYNAKLEISNCNFNRNDAGLSGGAVYSKGGKLKLTGSNMIKNSADYGGAIYSNNDYTYVTTSSFTSNSASIKGGAIYTKIQNVYSSGCTYSKNSAPAGSKVFGAFFAKITQSTYSKGNKIKVKLTSPWKMSLSQKIKLNFKGYSTKWLKTNSKGILTVKIPYKVKVGKSLLSISMKNGFCYIKTWNKIKDSAKFSYSKEVKKPSKIKITIKNKANGKLIKKTKFKVKIYTGKKYKTVNVKTNKKGVLSLSTKKLTRASHVITIILSNKNYAINKSIKIKIK